MCDPIQNSDLAGKLRLTAVIAPVSPNGFTYLNDACRALLNEAAKVLEGGATASTTSASGREEVAAEVVQRPRATPKSAPPGPTSEEA